MFCFVRSLIFFLLCYLQAPLKFAADLIDFLGSEAQVGKQQRKKKFLCMISDYESKLQLKPKSILCSLFVSMDELCKNRYRFLLAKGRGVLRLIPNFQWLRGVRKGPW